MTQTSDTATTAQTLRDERGDLSVREFFAAHEAGLEAEFGPADENGNRPGA